ncbi:AAA family ATPase [Haemophilus paracuniculus]|uniref:AAA family ATPase n=1 Tax=Haemophilus paracuniculus TaxID=734 RepID=UPI001FE3E4C2|nr:AAA family ATPase [Haemophilus paracuniculus]
MIILQSAEVYMPVDIEPYITLLEMPLPQEAEIKALIQQQAGEISEKLTARLATSLSGLNELEIQKVLKLIQNKFEQINEQDEKQSELIFEEIQRQKEQIIAKSGVLEMVKVDSKIDDIGGLENLKKWLNEQSEILNCLEEARAFGVKAPKGTLIAGMPGCGKSLTAKAASQLFQQPLLRLDIGSLLGKYVGESETNMRKALAMAESISPCVLWVDELEKAFVGMSGNNASEVSSRLLGYFLTWMQEKTKPVFIVATANDITALPPELLRKGRFDEIFYVGFPNTKERRQILEIHLKKANKNSENLPLAELAQLCRDYSGADIENAVYDGVKNAFLKNSAVTGELLKQAIKNTTPLRKTMKDKVGEYEKKFEELYLTPASQEDGLSIAQMIKMAKDPNYLERIKVAESDDVTEDILADLAKDEKLEVRKAVFNNPNCSTKLLDEQISLEKGHPLYNEEILTAISKHPNVSLGLALNIFKKDNGKIENLFTHQDLSTVKTSDLKAIELTHSIQQQIAKNPHISEELFDYLLAQKDYKVKSLLFVNNAMNIERQEKFANDSDPQIRSELSKNPNLAVKIQEKLANDSDLSVRQRLAENKNLNEDLIRKIIQKDELEINKIIAQRDNLSEEIQNILKEDPRLGSILYCNQAISSNIRTELQSTGKIFNVLPRKGFFWDKYPSKDGMQEIINQQITKFVNNTDFMKLASQRGLSTEEEIFLANHPDIEVRKVLAQNSYTSVKVKYLLADDMESIVLKTLVNTVNMLPHEIHLAYRNPESFKKSLAKKAYKEASKTSPAAHLATNAVSQVAQKVVDKANATSNSIRKHPFNFF